MTGWLKLTDDQRRLTLSQANDRSGIIVKALEKDWWVTLTLKALFQTPYRDLLIFKGGTTLSKCWKLINRFSEDIDIAMSPKLFGMEYADAPGSGYLGRLKRKGCAFTSNELKQALTEQLEKLGVPPGEVLVVAGEVSDEMQDKDPQELYVQYRSLYEPNPYLADAVKIEVSVRSKLEPYVEATVNSLLHDFFPNALYHEEPFQVLAVEPKKTFLEKAFLLHEQFHRGEQQVIKTERMSRHYHDLCMMADAGICDLALADEALYTAIIEHRRYYNKLRGIDYNLLQRVSINFYPPPDLIVAYTEDYSTMRENMIYGIAPEKNELFIKVERLIARFRTI